MQIVGLEQAIKIIRASLWWVILLFIIFWVPFLRVWWWVFTPLILSVEVRKLYFWWINWDYYYAKTKWHILEIIPPKEVLVPLKAMEDVFTVLWGALYNNPNWRERWCEGVIQPNSDWMSFEVVSIEGALHFYARVGAPQRHTLESTLYSHYPELEIREVGDYTKNVPQNVPNEEWDTYGEDWILTQPSALPIKTYEKFFEPQGEKIQTEEKRIDSMASLLELMSKLDPGEQYWMQFIFMSVSPSDTEWREEGAAIVAKMLGRAEKKKTTFFGGVVNMIYNIIFGPKKEGHGEKASYSWWDSPKKDEKEAKEKSLTQTERDKLADIENKLKQPAFRVNMRGVYVAKRDVYKSAHKLISRSYFAHFSTQNLNSFLFSKITRPKTQYVLRERIPFIRNRRMFRNAVLRFTPLFPDRKREMAILDPEEMATLFHFPIKLTGLVSPTMERVESKKSGPPPNLPT